LRDSGRAPKVAVDLERWMGVEHVRVGPLRTEQEFQDLIRVIAVTESRPQIDSPSRRPAGGLIAAKLQRAPNGGGQLRGAADVDVVPRKEAEEMGDVAVIP